VIGTQYIRTRAVPHARFRGRPAKSAVSKDGEKEGCDMNAKVKTTRLIQTALLCAGFFAGNAAWSGNCGEDATTAQAGTSDPDQAGAQTVAMDSPPVSRLDPELYSYLHDPEIHRIDKLGEDFGDFSAAVNDH
jgi:hypothetical protein